MKSFYADDTKLCIKLKDSNPKKTLIIVTFQRETQMNDYKYNVSFLITTNIEEYTTENPKVTCLTDVSDFIEI